MEITTNLVPRLLIDAVNLTAKEREGFDYLDWPAIDQGSDSATFFRYKGQLYSLDQFMRTPGDGALKDWHGYASDSFSTGVLVKYADDSDYVIVGRYCETAVHEGTPLDEIPHADYPHEPGRLYDCPRCEAECFCTGRSEDTECVFCSSLSLV